LKDIVETTNRSIAAIYEPGPVPPRGYWAKLQNRGAADPEWPQASTPHYLTCLDGLLTANKVAREFEFTPLRHAVLYTADILSSAVDSSYRLSEMTEKQQLGGKSQRFVTTGSIS
jgi:hypothetical protein